jgi:hypothetical protein
MGKSILGLLDISSVKFGTADVKLYLGTETIYPAGYYDKYLTMSAIENCDISFINYQVAPYYSLDSGDTWQLYESGDVVSVASGYDILWKGELRSLTSYGIGQFVASGKFDVSGNILSLINGDNLDATPVCYRFYSLFRDTKVVNAENLVLPIKDLRPYDDGNLDGDGAYCYLFCDCKYLVTIPKLPVTHLATSCFQSMFSGCESLVSVPTNYLPLTTLKSFCYQSMFRDCTNLIQAPELPAKILRREDEYCYDEMFQGCSKLAYVKCLAESIGISVCVSGIVSPRAENGIFVKSPLCDYWEDYDIIPEGWILVDDE